MQTNFIVKPDAEGTNNGKPYRGLVIATRGKEKSIAFAYLPDTFDETIGRQLAELKLKRKLIRRKQVFLDKQISMYAKAVEACNNRLNQLEYKYYKETVKQFEITSRILDLAD